MSKEDLQKRLADIEAALLQTQANYNALLGSKQEVTYWLQQLDKPAESPVELAECANS